ncbi:MAG: HD-GYP domain-containing protein [Anaerolineales bacterium]|nr:HD-GYP domain-containing protein [Anaerolineales bacterium]
MKSQAIKVYVGLTVVLAVGAMAVQDWALLAALEPFDWLGFSVLLMLGLLSESATLSISVGKKAGSTSSIIFLPLLASVLIFGPVPTVLFMGLTGFFGEFVIRRKETLRAAFNTSQYVVATVAGGLAFTRMGGEALVPNGPPFSEILVTETVAFVGFGLVFVILNNSAVAVAVALSEGTKIRKVWLRIVGRTGTNLFYDILVSPIAIAVALLYQELQFVGLFLIVLPLLFIRYAYSAIVELQQANRDLLSALVKAIETRDPYTSGHSLRVASLAVRIADAMGFSPKKQKEVEIAAKLHDIGKIESTYTEILSKPSGLTPEEREVIESHVLKGVEVLEQLSSFSKEVIASVRGHHERVDGKGYPDGLRGDRIPLAARIIKVCDAIDAMLSDRSYRRALTLEQVREQLVIYSGTQFDLEVVKASIEGDVLEAHQAEILLQKSENVPIEIPVHTRLKSKVPSY